MKITYLGHSGFLLEEDGQRLLFDAAERLPGALGPRDVVFVSHAHRDHWNEKAAQLGAPVVAGFDWPGATVLAPGEQTEQNGVRVTAFGSTDEGVSFLAEIGAWRVFHAGDLNNWHWRAESTDEEVAEAQNAFFAVLDTLSGQTIDVAFFPVDPRMGADHDRGAVQFMKRLRPGLLVPMHFWNQPEAAAQFAAKMNGAGWRVKALTQPGDSIEEEKA